MLVQIPSFRNNPSVYTEENSAARYFLAKLTIRALFVLFKFHQFKTSSSSVFAFKFSVQKSPLFLLQFFFFNRILLLVLMCSCVWFYFKQRIAIWKLLRIKIYRVFWFLWWQYRRITTLVSLETVCFLIFNISFSKIKKHPAFPLVSWVFCNYWLLLLIKANKQID